MTMVLIPPIIEEILSAAGHHRGLSPSLAAGLASIVRSIMRAYAAPDVDILQLLKALKKIGQCLAVDEREGTSAVDAAARADLTALARRLERVVDGSVTGAVVEAPAAVPVVVPVVVPALDHPEAPLPTPRAPPASALALRAFMHDIAAEQLDEAAFCLNRWEVALRAPHFTAVEVERGPEERLRAHLDALVIGGRPVAEELLLPSLAHDDPAMGFVAAWCLLASEDGDFDDEIVLAFAAADDPLRPQLARALALSPSGAVGDRLARALAGMGPAARAAAACVLTRSFTVSADVRLWLSSDDPALASGTLRGLRADGTAWTELIERHLRSSDPAVRRAAIRPGLHVGLVAAWDACVDAATGPDSTAEELIALAVLGGAAEHGAIERALADPSARRAALFALGFSGRRRAAELLLEIMGDADPTSDRTSARVAGDAFSAITGLSIEGSFARPEPDDGDLDDAAPPGFVEATPAEARLPLPDHGAIRVWWSSSASGFDRHERYLGGAPMTAPALVAAIAGGPMRRRPGYAFELAVRTRGGFSIDTADWVSAQRAALAASPIPRIADFTAIFGAGE